MATRTHIDHPTLGRLAYDKKLDWYSARVPVGGRVTELNIHCHGAKGDPPALRHAARIAGKLEALCRAAKDRAARDLLKEKNDTWRRKGERKVGAAGFKRLMELDGVVVYGDGSAEFYHLDGGLFWGHCVLLRMDKRGRFQNAAIAG